MIREYDSVQTRGMLAAARRQLGRIVGGDEGSELIAQGLDYFRAQQIADPDRFASTLVPGWER